MSVPLPNQQLRNPVVGWLIPDGVQQRQREHPL
eukprot:COSAG02_NODE_62437_length_266_cov_0.556886_1_plen_32_part_01